ncbi:MAG: dihydropteroate synthase [Saprospiraceae bacterium]|nr:dihydropteroate synthase [Saprospiraceae bacterium]
MLNPQLTLNMGGKLLILHRPIVMGILNTTPDSFYAGSRVLSEKEMLESAAVMLEEGAAILDVGGVSTRPGAEAVSEEEERRRVLPIIAGLKRHFPEALISVDTFRASIAAAAVAEGAVMVNDISAGRLDEAMYRTVAELGVPYVLMHMQGTPQTMQHNPVYGDVVLEVLDYLIAEVGKLRELGVKDIVIDPGFGFGKTTTHNLQLLRSLHVLGILELPVLAGISRKATIYKTLGVTAQEALNGTTALHMVALQQGAKILRVHDVKPAQEVIRLWEALYNAE